MAYFIVNENKIYPDFGSVSKWVAVGGKDPASHVRLKMQRVDSSSSSITSSSGNTQLGSITSAPSSLTVGGKVHAILYSAGSVVLAEGVFNIVSYSGSTLVIDCPYNAAFSFGRFNFLTDYKNHYYKVVYKVSGVEVGSSIHRAGPDATFWIDVSAFVRDYLLMESQNIPGSGNNDVANGSDISVTVELNNVFDGPDGMINEAASGPTIALYVVNAANQLQNPKGISLVDKITNNTPSQTLKFMCDCNRPTWFEGYPFHMTFIYSELMTDPVSARFEFLDGNGVQLSTSTNSLTDHKGHVNRVFIRTSVPSGTKTVQINIQKTTGSTQMSEVKYINYVDCAGRLPIYLKWMGPSGAWHCYVFSNNQIEALSTSNPDGLFESFIEDLAVADCDSNFVSVDTTPELTLGANGVSADDLKLLKTMLGAQKVFMLMNPETWSTDGEKYQVVKIKTGRFKIRETKSLTGDIEFSIVLPRIYIQMQ